jgi:hypothetical protein
MSDSVKVTIGGEEIELPRILNFAQLERTWPAVEAYSAAAGGVAQISAALAFIAGLLVETRPELNLAELKRRTRVERYDPATEDSLSPLDERPGIHTALSEICKASGLIPRLPPEPPAAPEASPSTAIGNI